MSDDTMTDLVKRDAMVLEDGETIRLWDEGTASFLKCEVLHRKLSKKAKSSGHARSWKYKLRMKHNGDVVSTRLVHVKKNKYKMRESKRRGETNAMDSTSCSSSSSSMLPRTALSPTKMVMPMSGNKAKARAIMEGIDVSRICAPMVGGSELAFRLLTRRYGCSLAYTPMISSSRFPLEKEYRDQEFQTTPEDRPLVAHFSANDPQQLLQSALMVQDKCDAIDLNLGCPQRIAHAGHFGSYLLDPEDRPLVLSIVKTVSESVSIPVFVKIRLLNTVPETIELVNQLAEAGASLVCIHGRYRVNLVGRTGAGARDGAAHLDQIAEVRKAVSPNVALISNGNVRAYEDLAANQAFTGTQGVMSAEGLLDNPAIFLPPERQPRRTQLALEYLDLATQYPVKMKSVIFHVRRICRDEFTSFQLMEECVQAATLEQVRAVVTQAQQYERDGYTFDPTKEARAKAALAKRKHEEGKRKRFEERMVRKAKREGKDPEYFLQQGAACPSVEELAALRGMPKESAFALWKDKHSQHCFEYHLGENKCTRDRTCAFLHADASYVANEAEVFG